MLTIVAGTTRGLRENFYRASFQPYYGCCCGIKVCNPADGSSWVRTDHVNRSSGRWFYCVHNMLCCILQHHCNECGSFYERQLSTRTHTRAPAALAHAVSTHGSQERLISVNKGCGMLPSDKSARRCCDIILGACLSQCSRWGLGVWGPHCPPFSWGQGQWSIYAEEGQRETGHPV